MTLWTKCVTGFGLTWALLAAACESDHYIDEEGFCREFPDDVNCPRPAGASGASGGTQGASGGPLMGSAGTAGVGGAGSGGSGGVACAAPNIECGGACVDVAAEAAHCGGCDYACEGGATCAAGACAPKVVVGSVTAPYAFVLDEANVYFVTPVADGDGDPPPAVRKAPKSGGVGATPVFDGAVFRSRSLALAEGTLYFGDLGGATIRKGPAAGTDDATHLTGQPAVQQLVAAGPTLWWSVLDPNARVRRAPPSGAGGAGGAGGGFEEQLPAAVGNRHFGRVASLAVEGAPAMAYWVNPVDTDAGLWRKAEGGEAQKLVPTAGLVALALGAGDSAPVYAATSTTLGTASKAAPQAALTPLPGAPAVGGAVQGLVATATHLYWLAFEGGGGGAGAGGAGGSGSGGASLALYRSGLDGADARVLGRVAAKSAAYWAQPIGAAQLVVDGGFVYFSDPGTVTGNTSDDNLDGVTGAADGAIYRLPE